MPSALPLVRCLHPSRGCGAVWDFGACCPPVWSGWTEAPVTVPSWREWPCAQRLHLWGRLLGSSSLHSAARTLVQPWLAFWSLLGPFNQLQGVLQLGQRSPGLELAVLQVAQGMLKSPLAEARGQVTQTHEIAAAVGREHLWLRFGRSKPSLLLGIHGVEDIPQLPQLVPERCKAHGSFVSCILPAPGGPMGACGHGSGFPGKVQAGTESVWGSGYPRGQSLLGSQGSLLPSFVWGTVTGESTPDTVLGTR